MLDHPPPEERQAAARRLLENLRARGFNLGVDYSYPMAPLALAGRGGAGPSGGRLRPRWLHLINHGPSHLAQLTEEDRGWLQALEGELISLVIELAIRGGTPDCAFCSGHPGLRVVGCTCGWEGQLRACSPDGTGDLRCPECKGVIPELER